MKRLLLLPVLAASLVLALSPPALANKIIPVSGTVFEFNPGDRQKVTVKGFGGCNFEVLSMTADEKVATVTMSTGAKKSHKLEIEATGVGMTDITITTLNGSNPGCQGFVFTYTVMVTPDVKAFQKAAKTKLKDTEKAIKEVLDQVVANYCTSVDEAVAGVKAGSLTIDEALGNIDESGAELASAIDVALGFAMDAAYGQLWSCPESQGFTAMDADLIGLLPGSCGEWDKFEGKIEKLVDKTKKKITSKYKKAKKQLDKFAQDVGAAILAINQLIFGVPAPITPVPLPADPGQTPAPAPPKPLNHTSSTSARCSDNAVTRLKIGGTADTGEGQVTVTIVGPDGFSDTKMVDVSGECAFTADFTGIKPGEYNVTITQGTQSSTFKANGA